jgi:Sulfotransferase domain
MPEHPVPDTRPQRPRRPDFLVIGAMKAGTTSLYQHLRAHPDVFMPATKELHFFPADKNWTRGMAWYEAQFAGSESSRVRGEASPSYSQADQFPGVAARVAETLPDVKLVYLVREPVARMQSMYLHQLASGAEARDVEVALRQNPIYLNSSRYAWQLDQYLEYFPRERVHVCTTEQLATDPTAALQGIFRFLDIDDTWTPQRTIAAGRSADHRVRSASFRELTRNRGYRAVVDRLPSAVRNLGRRVVTQPLDPNVATISPALDDELRRQLRPDVDRLRAWFPDAGLEAWDAP